MQSKLTSCPACLKMISIDSTSCVKCGQPFEEGELARKAALVDANWQQMKGGLIWAVIIIFVLILLCGLIGQNSSRGF